MASTIIQRIVARDWRRILEICSFISVTLAFPIAWIEYSHSVAKENFDRAQMIYREVDQAYVRYVALCIDHPQLDCYTEPESHPVALDPADKVRQKLMYDVLTDVFEVAYVHYVKNKSEHSSAEIQALYRDQWEGWDNYMLRFLNRPAYLATWNQIRDGYDDGLQCHVRSLMLSCVKPDLISDLVASLDDGGKESLSTWFVQHDFPACPRSSTTLPAALKERCAKWVESLD